MTVLFIHGGSHGAWCWDSVITRLNAAGVDCVAIDLPGSGADRTPRAALTLSDSVAAIVAAIDGLPAGPVTLVGHSIGGMPLPAAAVLRPRRVVGIVLIGAVVLRTGQRGIDSIPEDRRGSYFTMARDSGENSLLPSFDDAWARFFPSLARDDAREVYARLTPQPLGPYLEPAVAGFEQVDRSTCTVTYLLLTEDRTFLPDVARDFAERAGVTAREIPGDHCVMITDPDLLASVLVEQCTGNHG